MCICTGITTACDVIPEVTIQLTHLSALFLYHPLQDGSHMLSWASLPHLSSLFPFYPLQVGFHMLSWASLPHFSVMAAFWVSGGGSGAWLGWQVAESKHYAHDVTLSFEIIIELTNAKFYNMTNLSVVFAFWALEEGFGTWLGPQQSVLWLHWAASSFSAQQIAPPCLLHPWLFEVWLHQNTAPMRVVQGPVSPWEGRQNTFGMPRMLHLEQ